MFVQDRTTNRPQIIDGEVDRAQALLAQVLAA
jgi:hypothetical protein